MRGLTHFVSGVATATCFPQAVELAQGESSFIIVLGGIFGLLPDTFDFKYARFVENYHYHIDPDPVDPDPQKIADELAHAINEAHQRRETRNVVLHTIKKGADLWRQYGIFFDNDNQQVRITMGPLVNTSQKPYPGSEMDKPVGVARLDCKISNVYDKETKVDIMTGPSFAFIPDKDDAIHMDFLAWHRRWSHSLVVGAVFGAVLWALLSLWIPEKAWVYGAVATAAFWVHILEDQLGYMGSNLFWPFTKYKSTGVKYMHSGDVWPNFLAVWISLALIVYNLNNYSSHPAFQSSFWMYFLWTLVLPATMLKGCEWFLNAWEKRSGHRSE